MPLKAAGVTIGAVIFSVPERHAGTCLFAAVSAAWMIVVGTACSWPVVRYLRQGAKP
jgi:hypothetical protein